MVTLNLVPQNGIITELKNVVSIILAVSDSFSRLKWEVELL
jgi:hypothetical protein